MSSGHATLHDLSSASGEVYKGEKALKLQNVVSNSPDG